MTLKAKLELLIKKNEDSSSIKDKSMTTTMQPVDDITKGARDAIVDQLRACQSKEQLLAFEKTFNSEANAGPLYVLICEFLHDRTISPALAARWLRTILEDRENKLNANINWEYKFNQKKV